MQEKSLRVYQQKTFFSKIGSTISKLLIPTRIGINGVMISLKRNNVLKAYEALKSYDQEDLSKKETLIKKYDDVFTLYLEAIDKYVMDSIYKKVKNKAATPYEEEALSKYYMVTHLKETQYLEYKYRKQKYLLELDYENLKQDKKEKILQKYEVFLIDKMDSLYKGILKNYSVQLADNLKVSANDKLEIYDKVFDTVEEYILNILNLKMKIQKDTIEPETLQKYDEYAKFLAGKPDAIDLLEKKMIILAISRKLFTHSLPLIIAEQCYQQLLNEIRSEMVHTQNEKKYKKAYKTLLALIEAYDVHLLSTKIYWEKPKEREAYKKFWAEWKNIENSDRKDKNVQKEILFLKHDLQVIRKDEKRYRLVIQAYLKKLVELGVMKELKNSCKTLKGTYSKQKKKKQKKTKKRKVKKVE